MAVRKRRLSSSARLVARLRRRRPHAASRARHPRCGLRARHRNEPVRRLRLRASTAGDHAILGPLLHGHAARQLDERPRRRVLLQSGRRKTRSRGACARRAARSIRRRPTTSARGGGGLVIRDGRRTARPRARCASPPPWAARCCSANLGPGVRDALYRGRSCSARREAQRSTGVGLEGYVRGVVTGREPGGWPAETLKRAGRRGPHVRDRLPRRAATRSPVRRHALADLQAASAGETRHRRRRERDRGPGRHLRRPAGHDLLLLHLGRPHREHRELVRRLAPKPWLKGVDDPYDDLSPKHRWKPITLTTKQVNAKLRGLVRGKFRRDRRPPARDVAAGRARRRSSARRARPRSPDRSCAAASACSTRGPTSRR